MLPAALARARECGDESSSIDEASNDKTSGLSSSSPSLPRSTFESPIKKLSASSPKLRRIKSLEELKTPSRRGDKPSSPRSILDFTFSDTTGDSFCVPYDDPEILSDCAVNKADPSRASCLDALALLTSENGLLGQNFDWCCSAGNLDSLVEGTSVKETTLVAVDSSRSDKGCGGYTDYGGTYHPCTAATDKNHGPCQVSLGSKVRFGPPLLRSVFSHFSLPSKGCIFRGGMHSYKSEQSEAELYYDR